MSKSLEIKHTEVFSWNWEALCDDKLRFIINQGGSRSSKSFSLIQLVIVYCLQNPNKIVSIVRKTLPSLRSSVMRDFLQVMRELEIYEVKKHNKTENYYRFDNNTIIEFFSVDDEQKLRGRKRDMCWVNESNEINFEEFNQLNMRTTEKLLFDFNPSMNYHWLYDLMSRDECKVFHSTYKNNPFLSESQVKEIEYLINVDEAYYKIYALGERAMGKTNIFTHWKLADVEGEGDDILFGLDFGYNVPTSLVECRFKDNHVLVKELLYETNMTSGDLVRWLDKTEISKKKEIICDNARPEIIEDLRRAGYNAKEAIKNVKEGIDSVKSVELSITKGSVNLLKEIQSYKWKSNGDIILDEPVKMWDHAIDGMRYAIHYWKVKNKRANPNFFRIRY